MKRNKNALIYFSNTGKTKKIADEVINKFSPEVFEIKLKKPYGNFVSSVGRYIKNRILSKEDQVDLEPINLNKYDTVFIGSPVWAGKLPDFFANYLKKCQLGNQRIIPFATAAKTGKQGFFNELEEIFPDSKIENYFFQSITDKEDPNIWLDNIKKSI